jgi:hypothetical protein
MLHVFLLKMAEPSVFVGQQRARRSTWRLWRIVGCRHQTREPVQIYSAQGDPNLANGVGDVCEFRRSRQTLLFDFDY